MKKRAPSVRKPSAKTAPAKRRPRPAPPARAPGGEAAKVVSDDAVTLGDLKRMMLQFVGERDWARYHTPRNLAASVSVEAGELLELFQWLTPEEAQRRSREDPDFRKAVGEEMCDVLMYLIGLANVADIDVGQAVTAKMARNCEKYPVHKFKGWYERPLRK